MFNLGGDDKEKLKQNMEEIKELVNAEENADLNVEPDQQVEDEHGIADIKEEIQSALHRKSSMEDQQNTESQGVEAPPQRPEPQKIDPSDQDFQVDNIETPQENVNEDFDRPTPEQRPEPSMNQELKQNLNRDSNQNLNQDLNQSSSESMDESNTLFIEVDQFQDVQEKVEEMKYLSREMKDLMSDLEQGVQEGRKLESEARNVLKDFDKRRERIQASIK